MSGNTDLSYVQERINNSDLSLPLLRLFVQELINNLDLSLPLLRSFV